MSRPPHKWKFFRVGGFDQVRLDTGADLLHLEHLDQKLWVALACPAKGLEFDTKTLELMDTDKDGRIRAPELIAAVKWIGGLLKNPDNLANGTSTLPLDAINDATDEGRSLLDSAREMLAQLGRGDANAITLDDVIQTELNLAQKPLNGDGIIVADSTTEEATRAVINDIINSLDPETDRSGKPGIDQIKVDQFFAELAAFADWSTRGEHEAAVVLPLGDRTAAACAATKAVRTKVNDYFARCRMAAFDARAQAALNREEKDYLALANQDLSAAAQEVAGFPLAGIEPGKALPLKAKLNPAWADAMGTFVSDAVTPLLGDKSDLSELDWATLQEKLAPYESWQAGKAGAAGEKLGIARTREILASKEKEILTRLIAEDQALEPLVHTIASVEKLVRYYANIHLLCGNFVSFKDFYGGHQPAIFQAGTLYLDQRSCTLVLPVEDAKRHAALAGMAGTYLAYCDCIRKGSGEKRQIVAAFTDGDSDNLMVGRNGLFYDRKGRDWDATITRIVDHPISVRQAFWAPYKKLVRLMEERTARRAAAAEKASDARLATTATEAASADKLQPTEPKKVDVGTVAAMGVAFGALATAFAAIAGYLTGLWKLPFWQVCLAVLGLLLLVSGPSMLIAWLKLRKRNLGPILDANGWAVNARAKINVPFGRSLTGVAKLPPGSSLSASEKFGDAPSIWPKIIGLIIVIGFIISLLNSFHLVYRWTDGRLGTPPPPVKQDVKDLALPDESPPGDVAP